VSTLFSLFQRCSGGGGNPYRHAQGVKGKAKVNGISPMSVSPALPCSYLDPQRVLLSLPLLDFFSRMDD
jgi:hypothetical protein